MRLPAGTGHAAAFDRERSRIFLEKADLSLPDERLAALRSTSDKELGIDDDLLRAAMTAFGVAPAVRLQRSDIQGTFHRLYHVDEPGRGECLLRVATCAEASGSDLMALECRVMTVLREAQFPVPRCEFREVMAGGAARGAHLVDRAPGASLTTLDDQEDRMIVALAWVARFLARLHAIRGAGFGPVSLAALEGVPRSGPGGFRGVHEHWDDYVFLRLGEHLHVCEERGAISGQEANDIAARFAASRLGLRGQSPVLLHGDPGSHNFMVDASGLCAVIDWEDALLGDPLFDLAGLCTFHPERRHAAIWTAYGARLTPGDEEWSRFWLYFLRIALAKTVHRFRFAYADRPGRAPAAQRIQLALAKLGEGA